MPTLMGALEFRNEEILEFPNKAISEFWLGNFRVAYLGNS